MNIDNAVKIPGWMTEDELRWLAEQATKRLSILEIGSWQGRSARVLTDNTYGNVFCVDTWHDDATGISGWWPKTDRHQRDWLWQAFQRNLSDRLWSSVFPIKASSEDAFRQFKAQGAKFDMIFIDADHSFEGVTKDIFNWSQLVTDGGMLCGHDYNHPQCPQVAPAVNAYFGSDAVVEAGTIWSVRQ